MRFGHGHPVRAARERPELKDEPDDDEVGREGRHDEVEPPDLQRGQAEDEARDACRDGGGGERGKERPAQFCREDGRDIGPDGHEPHMTHGYLAAVTGEDIKPVDGDDAYADHGENGDGPVGKKGWTDNEECEEGRKRTPLRAANGRWPCPDRSSP